MNKIQKLLFFLLCNSSMLYPCWCINKEAVAPVILHREEGKESATDVTPRLLDELLRDNAPSVADRQDAQSNAVQTIEPMSLKKRIALDTTDESVIVTNEKGEYVVIAGNGRYVRPIVGRPETSPFLSQVAKQKKAVLESWERIAKDPQESWPEDFKPLPVMKKDIASMLSYRANKK